MRTLQELTRPNVWALKPYSSARDEYSGVEASVFLDANENPYHVPYNRYPDPLQHEVKQQLSQLKGVSPASIFLGNGSDEAIDLLFRAFCEPGVENVVAIDPTYGMYQVCAEVNNVAYRKVLLDAHYQFQAADLLAATDKDTKLIFLCSPNNPTGNSLQAAQIEQVLKNFDGLVIVDEAYIDFSPERSWLSVLETYPNLVVLQTFSKAWGCAAIRLGMAFASPQIIGLLNKIKYPYNVNILTQQEALRILGNAHQVKEWVDTLLAERSRLVSAFQTLPCCEQVYPTDANFFLAKVSDAKGLYDYLVSKGIIVRNRTNVSLCHNCLRITIGTPDENAQLLAAIVSSPFSK
ncbi:MAG: histidinol-phosphate transaminase [Phocaeicola sp.]